MLAPIKICKCIIFIKKLNKKLKNSYIFAGYFTLKHLLLYICFDARICNVTQSKVAVGMDTAPPQFNLVNRVEGSDGAHLQFIANQSGASVTLKGRGSGFLEPATGLESPSPLHVMVE